jgi:hypothetical protein
VPCRPEEKEWKGWCIVTAVGRMDWVVRVILADAVVNDTGSMSVSGTGEANVL